MGHNGGQLDRGPEQEAEVSSLCEPPMRRDLQSERWPPHWTTSKNIFAWQALPRYSRPPSIEAEALKHGDRVRFPNIYDTETACF